MAIRPRSSLTACESGTHHEPPSHTTSTHQKRGPPVQHITPRPAAPSRRRVLALGAGTALAALTAVPGTASAGVAGDITAATAGAGGGVRGQAGGVRVRPGHRGDGGLPRRGALPDLLRLQGARRRGGPARPRPRRRIPRQARPLHPGVRPQGGLRPGHGQAREHRGRADRRAAVRRRRQRERQRRREPAAPGPGRPDRHHPLLPFPRRRDDPARPLGAGAELGRALAGHGHHRPRRHREDVRAPRPRPCARPPRTASG